MIRGYYFITDEDLSRAGNVSDVKNAVQAGVSVVQFRSKKGNTRELFEEAVKLRKICKGIKFIVNDRVDIALAVGASGVHLGQKDMPPGVARKLIGHDKIIGVTVHNLKEASAALDSGADYLGVSPVYSTSTKKDAGAPCGVSLIEKIKKISKVPVAAIGGITFENAGDVISAGADALCAISAVVPAENVKKQIKKFQSLFSGC
ncbi:MAG: thiamine phosphate synthase [bacterium]